MCIVPPINNYDIFRISHRNKRGFFKLLKINKQRIKPTRPPPSLAHITLHTDTKPFYKNPALPYGTLDSFAEYSVGIVGDI